MRRRLEGLETTGEVPRMQTHIHGATNIRDDPTHPCLTVLNVFCTTVVMNQFELEKEVPNRIASRPRIISVSRAGAGPLFSACDALTLRLGCPSDGSRSEEWNILFLHLLITQRTSNSLMPFIIHVFIHSSNIYRALRSAQHFPPASPE